MTDATVAAAVARREENPVEARLHSYEAWYAAFVPKHMPASQLVALSIAQLRKSRRDGGLTLYDAAMGNPASFYAAVAECGRLGLVPGVTYHYTPFNDRNATNGVAVVGMTDWKGEVQLIHQAGGVETVVCEVVREGDLFRWDPSQMRVPEHSIPANDAGQVGLGDPADRGKLTGVYCYVRFTGGGISHPTVMSAAEVKRHFAKAKSKKFWGEWPDNAKYPAETPGSWTAEMFKKTAIHRHADSVPTSVEYLQVMNAARVAAAADMPAEVAEGYAEASRLEGYELPAPYENGNGGPNPKSIAGAVERSRAARPMTKADALKRLGELLHECGMPSAPEWHTARLVLAGAFATGPEEEPLILPNAKALTQAQAVQAVGRLEAAIREARSNGEDLHQVMLARARDAGWEDDTRDEPSHGGGPDGGGEPDG